MGDATIPSDWSGEYCKYAVCWPKSDQWLAVLRNALAIPATGRYWNEDTGHILTTQAILHQTFDTNFHLKEVIMACGDAGLNEIADALVLIAVAMNNQASASIDCCGGASSGGAGPTLPPFNPIGQGEPTIDPPPEGFETWEEFLSDKCAVANYIVETLRSDLLQIALINFGTLSIEAVTIALAIVLTLAIPATVMIGIATLLIGVAAEVVITSLISIINDNFDDLVCQLYNGESSDGSSTLFHSALGGYADAGISDPISNFAVKTLAKYMVNSSVCNKLYEKDLTKVWPSSDCSNCAPCDPIERVWIASTDPNFEGTLVNVDGDTVSASNDTPAPDGNFYAAFNDENFCPFLVTNVFTTNTGGFGKYQNCAGEFIQPVSWDDVIGIPVLGIGIEGSDTACSITADVEATDCP